MSEREIKSITIGRRTDGISGLRDQMAAAALTGLLANPNIVSNRAQMVSDAWAIADKMVDARDADLEGNIYRKEVSRER